MDICHYFIRTFINSWRFNLMMAKYTVALAVKDSVMTFVEMSSEEITDYVETNNAYLFIDNREATHISGCHCQSKIEIICVGSLTCDFQEVTLHKPYREIVNKRMSTRETSNAIKNYWVIMDNVLVAQTSPNLNLTNGTAVEIFDYPPQQGIVIQSPNLAVGAMFPTFFPSGQRLISGTYSIAEIETMVTGESKAIAVDGEFVTYPTITVDLHEQSRFAFSPPLGHGCESLECQRCGGVYRKDVRQVTSFLLESGRSNEGCWSDQQLHLLGIAEGLSPLENHEIMQSRVGEYITAGNYERFIDLKNAHL